MIDEIAIEPTEAEVQAAADAIQSTFELQGFSDETPGNTEADQYRDMARAALTAAAQVRKAGLMPIYGAHDG